MKYTTLSPDEEKRKASGSSGFTLTPTEEQEICAFLFDLHEGKYLSIDITQAKLAEKFPRFDKKQAFDVLCRLRNADLIGLEDGEGGGWKWIPGT
jgi:hypothetical protein